MIFGIDINKKNPAFTATDFVFWMPKMKPYMETSDGQAAFEKFYPLANQKIFKSIFGSDWEYAISLAIAHYMMLRAKQLSATNDGTPSGLAGNDAYNFILQSVGVGSFSKSFDAGATLVTDSDDAKFWNLTSFGAILMALYKTKYAPSIFVVTPTNVPMDPIAMFYARQGAGSWDILMREKIKYLEKQIDNKQDKGDYVVSIEKE